MGENESLDQIYKLLEKQERTIFYEYHKDIKIRESIIKRAQDKITALKMLGNEIGEDIILLGDDVSLEIAYGPTEIEVVTHRLVLSLENINDLSLFSAVGDAVFAQRVGDEVKAILPDGSVANIKIIAKNKDIFEEKRNNK